MNWIEKLIRMILRLLMQKFRESHHFLTHLEVSNKVMSITKYYHCVRTKNI